MMFLAHRIARAEAPTSCEIETRIGFQALRFATPDGVVVRAFPEHNVAIRPRSGHFEVRFLEPVELVAEPGSETQPSRPTLERRRRMAARARHAPAPVAVAQTAPTTESLTANTREELRVVLRNAIALDGGTVNLPAGAVLLELLPTEQGVRARVEIGDGVVVERVQFTCADLAIEAAPPTVEPVVEASSAEEATSHQPEVHARVSRVHLHRERNDGHSTALSLPVGFRFLEIQRRVDWVQVERRISGSMLRGWLRPWDLEDVVRRPNDRS